MFPHQFVEGVSIESSHEEEKHLGALVPVLVLLILEKSSRDANGHGFSGSRSFESDKLSDRIS